MKLQELQFPNKNICIEQELYYHTSGDCRWSLEGKPPFLLIKKGAVVTADTYFNSFSFAKWTKYTGIKEIRLRLKLQGSVEVRLISRTIEKDYRLHQEETSREEFRDVKEEIVLPLCGKDNSTSLAFEITAIEDTIFYGGSYETVQEVETSPCRIAIDICTFKREAYVERNMTMLNDYLIENEHSTLFHNLYVYIQDNGQTLDKEKIESDYITITPNRNTGGVGGFTRGMLNVLRDKEEKGFTHILIMDDDAVINPYAIEKTAAFIRLLLPEYRDITVGGALFLLDTPYMQFECGASWNQGRIISNYSVMDMRNPYMPVRTEMEDVENKYMAWWYCCMPLSLISTDNLPLPIFIHIDDVEYGLRACTGGFVTMNGIGIWHEAFVNKITGVNEYYDVRNALIVSAIHYPDENPRILLKNISNNMTRKMVKLRYQYARMNLRGLEDFLKGIDWMEAQDGVALHQEISAMNYKACPVTEFGVTQEECDRCTTDFDWKHLMVRENTKVEGTIYRFCRRMASLWKKIRFGITFNGLFLPGKKELQIVEPDPAMHRTYRAKRVLHYTLNGKGFVTERDIHQVISCYREFFRLRKLFLKNYSRVCMEYHNRYHEITNKEFWEKYLKMEGEKNGDNNSEFSISE